MLSLGDGKIGTWSTEMGVDDATRIDTGSPFSADWQTQNQIET